MAGGPPDVVARRSRTGKTNTLAHRVARLIVQGADPRRILLQHHNGMTLHECRGSRTGRPGGTPMASRLQLNGWRRLWLAASAGLAIWFVVVWPLQYLKEMQFGRYGYDRAIEEDFEKRTMPNLPNGTDGNASRARLWQRLLHIYLSRKFDNTVPYTLEAYKIYSSARDREQYLAVLAVGAAGTAIVSGLVYFSDG